MAGPDTILPNGNTLFEYHIPCNVVRSGYAVVRAKSAREAEKMLHDQDYAKVMYDDLVSQQVNQVGEPDFRGVSPIKPKTSKKRSTFD